MLSEYRTWLTVRAPEARSINDWEHLLTKLAESPQTRGPVMKSGWPYGEAEFTVSYPATDPGAAGKESVEYVRAAIEGMGWPACQVTVDQVDEIDLEKELQEDRL